MNNRVTALFVAFLFLFTMFGCSDKADKLPVLGTKNPKAKLIDSPSLALAPAKRSGKQVKIILKYNNERPADMKHYRLIRMSDGTAQFYVEVRIGVHDQMIETMQSGEKYMVYGRYEYDMVKQRNFIYVD